MVCTFSQSVIGSLVELADVILGLPFVLYVFHPFQMLFLLFSSTLKVERGFGLLLLLNGDLAA